MRAINRIIVHCTATRPEWMSDAAVSDKVREIDAWHRERGWSGIGYHYLVDRDGCIGHGRSEATQGAHTRGHNGGSIGVALVGGHGAAAADDFHAHFTVRQSAVLRRLIASIEIEHGPLAISGHNEYAAKACPGFAVRPWLASGA